MTRPRFPLSSDQLELLLAFDSSPGLTALAAVLGRDPSVVSRNLQKLAAALPVIEKVEGRWRVTRLGQRVNGLARDFLAALGSTLNEAPQSHRQPFYRTDRAVLLLLNAQRAFEGKDRATERRLQTLLARWRRDGRPVVHVRHVSQAPSSRLRPGSPGAEFISLLAPLEDELVVSKRTASAFVGTGLAAKLRKRRLGALVIAGFTAGECVDATARSAVDLGFTACVVGDATGMFDVTGPDGKAHVAARAKRVLLAALHETCAPVLSADEVLGG